MGAVTATFRVVSDEATPAPVDGVAVRVFSLADAFVTEGVTGAATPGSGEVNLTLDGDVGGTGYIVRLGKDGWSFALPEAPIVVYDPPGAPPDDNVFQSIAHEGLVGQLVTLTTIDPYAVPIEEVRIRLYDENDIFITEVDSGPTGEVALVLQGDPSPGKDYYARLLKDGWIAEEGPTQVVKVLDPVVPPLTNTFDFTFRQPQLDESQDPKMCMLTGYFVDASGRGLKGVGIRFRPRLSEPECKLGGLPFPSTPTLLSGKAIIAESHFVTDSNGRVQLELPRGGLFDVLVNGLETPGNQILELVTVPDAPVACLEDILWPYVTGVTYAPTSVSLLVDEEVDVEVSVEASNGYSMDGGDYGAFLEFSLSDDTVAEMTVVDGTIKLRGLQAGSTSVQVARVDGSLAPRLPSANPLNVTPLTVTVS
jgi:hypothetical protein